LEHAVVAHRDDGKRMFNLSEWLGTTSTVVVSNTYHADNQRGFAPAAQRVGYSILQDMGFDVLREFWPEISRKFKLPFRGEPERVSPDSNPATK
jgi:preprotein translocase subunit SecA